MTSPFDRMIDRHDTNSIKWDLYGKDVLPMWVADADYPAPEPVLQALRLKTLQGVFGYEIPPRALRETVASRMQRLYGWALSPDDIVTIPGIVTGINVAARAYAHVGDGILMQPPVYPPFMGAAKSFGLTADFAPLTRSISNGRLSYGIDFEAFERAITPRTKFLLLCQPHNPTGQVYTPDEIRQMTAIALRHDLVIVSDEIHSELTLGDTAYTPTALAAPEAADRLITFVAPTKTFNLAGLGCGFAIIPNARLRAQYQAAAEGIVPLVSAFSLAAAHAAFGPETDGWLTELRGYLTANRDTLLDFVAKRLPGVAATTPAATYLAWLDFSELNLHPDPHAFVLHKAKVGLNDGMPFGPGGAGCLRLNFACPRERLLDGLERIAQAVDDRA